MITTLLKLFIKFIARPYLVKWVLIQWEHCVPRRAFKATPVDRSMLFNPKPESLITLLIYWPGSFVVMFQSAKIQERIIVEEIIRSNTKY